MNRRSLIAALAGAPFSARAQTAERRWRIGYLSLGSPAAEASRYKAFREGLAARGYVEGRNIELVDRWLDGRKYEQLGEMAAELVGLKVDVIATYSAAGVKAAQRATGTIPIVFLSVGDAVAVGLVASLARPGGNATGTSYFLPEIAAKRLDLLKEAMPSLGTVGVLFNPANGATEAVLAAARTAAQGLKLGLVEAAAKNPGEIDGAVAALAEKGAGAFTVNEDPMLIYSAPAVAAAAAKHRLGACGFPELATNGGLMAYGIDLVDLWYRGALFIDRIFKGASPADIPVEQATKFLLLVNLKTAGALGVSLPLALTARADETID